MRILIVDTFYPAFLAAHYAANPGLETRNYDVQWRSLMDRCFATSDSFSYHLTSHGHAAHEFIVNCAPLQERWAAENGFSIPPSRYWGDRRRADAILRAQAEWYAADVCYVQNLEILTDTTLREFRRLGCLLVGHLSTEPPSLDRLRHFDLIVSPVPSFVEQLNSAGVSSSYLPLAFDTRIVRREGTRLSERWGAVFVGSLKRYRRWSSEPNG